MEGDRRREKSEPQEYTELSEADAATVMENSPKQIWPDTKTLARPGGGLTFNGGGRPEREREVNDIPFN